MKLNFAVFTAICTLIASPLSWACAYDGQFNNPFSESYPGALDVAIATQDALNAQILDMPIKLEGTKGLRRVSWWLQLFSNQYSNDSKNTNIYLIDSQLWSQLGSDSKLAIHTQAPASGQKVLLITEITLHNIVTKKLSLQNAKEQGLVWSS